MHIHKNRFRFLKPRITLAIQYSYAATRCNTLQHTATHCKPLHPPIFYCSPVFICVHADIWIYELYAWIQYSYIHMRTRRYEDMNIYSYLRVLYSYLRVREYSEYSIRVHADVWIYIFICVHADVWIYELYVYIQIWIYANIDHDSSSHGLPLYFGVRMCTHGYMYIWILCTCITCMYVHMDIYTNVDLDSRSYGSFLYSCIHMCMHWYMNIYELYVYINICSEYRSRFLGQRFALVFRYSYVYTCIYTLIYVCMDAMYIHIHPTQFIIYVPLQVIRFHKSILLIVQYKYLKSCSEDIFLKNLILRTRSCGTVFIAQHSWLLHFRQAEICLVEMICTTVVPASKGHLGGASP